MERITWVLNILTDQYCQPKYSFVGLGQQMTGLDCPFFFQFTYNWSGYPQSASTVDVLQIVDHSSLGVVYGQRKGR